MDRNRVEGNWKQAKGKVKEQWGKLTDDDLTFIAGKRDQLEGKFRSATASRGTRFDSRSTTGSSVKTGESLRGRLTRLRRNLFERIRVAVRIIARRPVVFIRRSDARRFRAGVARIGARTDWNSPARFPRRAGRR